MKSINLENFLFFFPDFIAAIHGELCARNGHVGTLRELIHKVVHLINVGMLARTACLCYRLLELL